MIRSVLALAGILVAAVAGASAQEPPKPAQIVFNGAGGETMQKTRQVFLSEFERRYGIRVVESTPINFAKLRAMVDSGNIEWTVTEIGGEDAIRAERTNLFEPVDRSIVPVADMAPQAQERTATLARSVYSTVLAYRKDAFKDGVYPTGWKDFWDVKRFPGPRSMRNRPIDNLEIALIADGVPVDKLYPLDVDRAFRKLDEIKPHVTVWWAQGQQTLQLLTDREVIMTTGFNGRFYPTQREGGNIDVAWAGAMVKVETFGVVKGAKDAYWGQKLLALFTEPALQARYAEVAGYPGLNPKSWEIVDKAVYRHLPNSPENLPVVAWTSDAWWADNNAAMQERFARWLLGP